MIVVDRRRFVVIAVGLLIAPGAFAQLIPAASQLIGILHHGTRADSESELAALKEGLREAGFVEGRNLRIEYRFAEYDYLKLKRLAEELVSANVHVIYAPTTWTVRAARTATNTVPIVFSGVNDPVPHKFVQSLARPGGNITGISLASAELTAKRVQLMRELFPAASRFGVVFDKDAARECGIELREIGAAGQRLDVEMRQFPYDARIGLENAFEDARRDDIGALLVPTTYETRRFGAVLMAQSSKSRIPLVHSGSEAVEAGGLMSYGPDRNWASRRAGQYIARILRGVSPSELPVERPTKYELVVNLKTARAMGITIPQSVLLRADRVIE
jgi:putative ABC transport system substrate-binding protein